MIDATYINADTEYRFGMGLTPEMPRQGDLIRIGSSVWKVKEVVHQPVFGGTHATVVGFSPEVWLTYVKG